MSSFKLDALERTVRTIVQASAAAVLLYVTGAVGDGGFDAIDWSLVWKAGAAAGLLSFLTALAAKQTGSPNDASFTGGES